MTQRQGRSIRMLSTATCGLVLLMVLLGGSGCSGKAILQKLVDQNRQAGKLVAEKATSPVVIQAGKDIEANATEHQAWIGQPKTSSPYTPKTSATVRAQSKYERETSWLEKFIGGKIMEAILNLVNVWFPALGGIGGLLMGAFGMWKKWKADKKVRAGYEAANNIFKTIKDGKGLSIEGVKSIFSNAQSIWNVGPEVRKDLEALWAKRSLSKVDEPPAVVK